MEAIKRSAAMAAEEASAVGLNWTLHLWLMLLAMQDGVELWKAQVRMLLGSKIAVAESKVSGNRFSCHKYYFGLCQTFCRDMALQNREGITVDVSENYLTEYYISSFLKQLLMPVRTFMNSFNELNGIPAGNRYLQEKY
jgi:beta-glucosidase